MAMGMFVDTTLCIGCKACQVACKQWNGLAGEPAHFAPREGSPAPVASHFTGDSYDNTGELSARDWRRVRFIERIPAGREGGRWLFMSDSCKHCTDAACLNVCPVQAIERSELGNVVVRQNLCVGSRHCNRACPYGVIRYSEETRTSWKCTLCDERIHAGLLPACAKACPTGSIRFGSLPELMAAAKARLPRVRAAGEARAGLYGFSQAGGLKVFYLLRDAPSAYGLPEDPAVTHERAPLPRGASLPAVLAELAGSGKATSS